MARGIVAMAVLVFHCINFFQPWSIRPVSWKAHYLIRQYIWGSAGWGCRFSSYCRDTFWVAGARGSFQRGFSKRFWLRRFLRIYPVGRGVAIRSRWERSSRVLSRPGMDTPPFSFCCGLTCLRSWRNLLTQCGGRPVELGFIYCCRFWG